MTRPRLFPEPPKDDPKNPRERFDRLATKVFTTPKSTVDAREQHWKAARRKTKATR
jgi:hypothetical protein